MTLKKYNFFLRIPDAFQMLKKKSLKIINYAFLFSLDYTLHTGNFFNQSDMWKIQWESCIERELTGYMLIVVVDREVGEKNLSHNFF